jgi:DNA modification methylase
LDQVPVRFIELANPNPYHAVSFNIRTEKDNYTLLQEIKVLKKIFNPGQGYRSDLLGSNISLNNFLGVKINVVKRLWNIHLVCSELFGEGSEEYENIVSKLKNETIHTVQKFANRKLIEKKKVKKFTMPVFDEFRVFNRSSENPVEVFDNSIQSIITSPPYYKMRKYGNGETELGREFNADSYVNDLLKIISTWKRILKKDGSFVLNINESNKGLPGYPMVCERLFSKMPSIGFELKHRMFWIKRNPLYDGGDNINNAVEFIYIFGHCGEIPKLNTCDLDQDTVSTYGDKILNVLNGNVNQPTLIRSKLEENGYFLGHTAMMPEYLARTLVQLTTDENDLVFDGFSGLGTTGRMANELGRKYVGYEINEEYFKQSLILKKSTLQIAA